MNLYNVENEKSNIESYGLDIRIFRSSRIWLSNPHGRMVGFGFVLTGIVFSVFMLLLGNRFSPETQRIGYYILAGVALIGVIMIIRCKFNDPENIHSFALTDDGDLYHILVAIPQTTEITLHHGKYKKEHVHQQAGFSGIAGFSCGKDFESSVREVLLNKDRNLKWRPTDDTYSLSAYIIYKMEAPVTPRITITGAAITYKMEGRDITLEAKLFRHNRGYKTILNHIQSSPI